MWGKARHVKPTTEAEKLTLLNANLEAEHEYIEATQQARKAEEVVSALATTRLRNGFAPAIEASIRRRLGGQT